MGVETQSIDQLPDTLKGFILREIQEGPERVEVADIILATRKDVEAISSGLDKSELQARSELGRLARDPSGYATMVEFIDRFARPENWAGMMEEMSAVLEGSEMNFLDRLDTTILNAFKRVPGWARFSFLVPVVVKFIKGKVGKFLHIKEGDTAKLGGWVALQRYQTGLDYTVNIVTEDVHGESQAEKNMEKYRAAIADPNIRSLAVKPTAICPNVSAADFDGSVKRVKARLVELFRLVDEHRLEDGAHKLVTVDMEDSTTLDITVEAFKAALSEVKNVPAGIALQFYLGGETTDAIENLKKFAKRDMTARSSDIPRITIRAVKGANMPLERRIADIRGGQSPVLEEKYLSDASFMAGVETLLSPEYRKLFNLSVGTMNLRNAEHACRLIGRNNAWATTTLEQLNGMTAVETLKYLTAKYKKLKGRVYLPVVEKGAKELLEGLAYLVRRLQEVIQKEGFLNDLFLHGLDTEAWTDADKRFVKSWQEKARFPKARRVMQNRGREFYLPVGWGETLANFRNSALTAWHLEDNREWAAKIRERAKGKLDKSRPVSEQARTFEIYGLPSGEFESAPTRLPFSGLAENGERELYECTSPTKSGETFAEVPLVNKDDIDDMYTLAEGDPDVKVSGKDGQERSGRWSSLEFEDRFAVLARAFSAIENSRAGLIEAAMIDTGMNMPEADGEVCEAADFAKYYLLSARDLYYEQLACGRVPKGSGQVTTVIAPWNFPEAIGFGGAMKGLVDALSKGNTVIWKPSPKSIYCTMKMAEILWASGIPKSVLQIAPCNDDTAAYLTSISNNVVFTGGTTTAAKIQVKNPKLRMTAETGGNNAVIVAQSADLDKVVSDIVSGITGRSAQKCSAPRMIILLKGVDRAKFYEKLEDAMKSLKVGQSPIEDPSIDIVPLIEEPPFGSSAHAGLHQLDDGEMWLIEPQKLSDNLYTPGIKKCDGLTASCRQEQFVPVVKVIEGVASVADATAMVNSTGYGLTAGLMTMDEGDVVEFLIRIRAGNVYVNRGITGAVVGRQPFGGMLGTLSKYGAPMHAGGPDYLLVNQTEPINDRARRPDPNDTSAIAELARKFGMKRGLKYRSKELTENEKSQIEIMLESFAYHARGRFAGGYQSGHRVSNRTNLYRYLPLAGKVAVRLTGNESAFEVLTQLAANVAAGNEMIVSAPESMRSDFEGFGSYGFEGVSVDYEADDTFMARLEADSTISCLAYCGPEMVPEAIYQRAAELGVWLDDAKPSGHGRFQLPRRLQGQSVSVDHDRFGDRTLQNINPETIVGLTRRATEACV